LLLLVFRHLARPLVVQLLCLLLLVFRHLARSLVVQVPCFFHSSLLFNLRDMVWLVPVLVLVLVLVLVVTKWRGRFAPSRPRPVRVLPQQRSLATDARFQRALGRRSDCCLLEQLLLERQPDVFGSQTNSTLGLKGQAMFSSHPSQRLTKASGLQ
jgi:hypothetical protein